MAQGKRNEPTIEPTEADYWYAAGFIDGDGCITIRESGTTAGHKARLNGWNPSWYASVTISQAHPHGAHLQWFADRWGGSIRKKFRRPPATETESGAREWLVVGRQCYRLLEGALPMLMIKRPNAENALKLRELRMGRGYARKNDDGRRNYLTDDDIAARHAIRAEALRLNRRGRRPDE